MERGAPNPNQVRPSQATDWLPMPDSGKYELLLQFCEENNLMLWLSAKGDKFRMISHAGGFPDVANINHLFCEPGDLCFHCGVSKDIAEHYTCDEKISFALALWGEFFQKRPRPDEIEEGISDFFWVNLETGVLTELAGIARRPERA